MRAQIAACGARSTAAIAGVDRAVAQRIYNGELHGNEVKVDLARISRSRELLGALSSSNTAAVYAAVHKIIYTPHWHITRLRVVRGGHVLADVGGPYVIAPVSGTLRSHGRTLASFEMSVQDDVGYVKLVTRFIGVPIDLYRGGSFLMGTLEPAPSSVNNGQSLTVGKHSYRASVLDALAFPTGSLKAAIFTPSATNTIAAQSCAHVRVDAGWGGVVKHIAARFNPLAAHYGALVGTLDGSSGGLAYVRAGSELIAGGPSPARLPQGGIVHYRGRSWSVFSWAPIPPARIYLLTPAA